MHSYTYHAVKALHSERMRQYQGESRPLDPPRHGLRARIGHNLIQLGERIARIDRHEKLGEAA